MRKIIGLFVILISFSANYCWSDDLDSVDSGADNSPTASKVEHPDNFISDTKRRFAALKKRGTVWLKTQQAIDQLAVFEQRGRGVEARAIARQIAHDCRLIENQQALEQARYMFATLQSSGVDDRELNAIRTQLMAADGEASFALASHLWRELELRTPPQD